MLDIRIQHTFGAMTLDVDLSVPAGVTALFGRSGTGKTSIANALAGLLRPDVGRITLNREVLFDSATGRNLRPEKRRIGYVFQEGRLFDHLSVTQNLSFGARFAPDPLAPDARDRVIDMLGIAHLLSRRPATLSGGERQRVALGRALLMRPRALIMDEPLAALDQSRKEEVLPYLERLRDQAGIPILYVSHAMDEVARLADRIAVLEAGRVARAGEIFEVLSDPAVTPLIGVRAAGAVLRARVAGHDPDGLTRLQCSAGIITVPAVDAPEGAEVRIRVLAQDVILSRAHPVGLSTRTILPVTVRSLHSGAGPGTMLALRAGEDHLLARLTTQAVKELGLVPGQECFAVFKATAIARADVGTRSQESAP